ncbi:succinate dehydrogenase cytochrome b subunit [bacterium]|nr:succinate dehydrogenase cytochrome b subunit [bacterium]
MSWLLRALSTSIGQKFVMGITGLLLCGFLVAHLGGNFFLFVGADAYNDYAEALHKQEALLKVAEAGLIVLFAVHLYLAFVTTRGNKVARGSRYAMTETKQDVHVVPGGSSSWMFVTGSIVLGFVILHLVDFTFQVRPDIEYSTTSEAGDVVARTPFEKAKTILSNPVSAVVYLIGCIALGVHLAHGFGSAFQSLGLNHPRYKKIIQTTSVAFGWLIAVGFISFVAWAFWQPA